MGYALTIKFHKIYINKIGPFGKNFAESDAVFTC